MKPDTSVYALQAAQPEFQEQTWQYLYRRVSDWRIRTGKEMAKENAALLGRIEKEYGVDRYLLLALWGVESAYGDPMVQQKYMRPVFPALAALAWGEPRRRAYWEQELLNALLIVERGWSTPQEMRGSWAGAMGHTQWMPEVWLHVGIDFDQRRPGLAVRQPGRRAGLDRALSVRARQVPPRRTLGLRDPRRRPTAQARTYAAWQAAGVTRADGAAVPASESLGAAVDAGAGRAGVPDRAEFLRGAQLQPVDELRAGDRASERPAARRWSVQAAVPRRRARADTGGVQDLQQRLTKAGFDTGGIDGRVGNDTMRAVRAWQEKVGMEPADGYAGLKVLARLRGAA